MKFYTSGISRDNKPLFVALWFFLVFILFYWGGTIINYSLKFGFSVEKISYYYFGSEQFPEKISFIQLSEDTHIYLFTNAILLLSLSGIFLYSQLSFSKKLWLIAAAFLFGLLDSFAGQIIYFGGRNFAVVKNISFVLFNCSLLAMILSVFSHFFTGRTMDKPNGKTNQYYSFVIFTFAILNILFVAVNFILTYSKLGFTPNGISNYYLGNEAGFIQPKSFEGMMETATIHFAVMAIYLVALAHFVFFTEFRWKLTLVILIFTSALIDIMSGFAIRFLAVEFSYLKITAFWLMQFGMLYASYILIKNSFTNNKDSVQPAPDYFHTNSKKVNITTLSQKELSRN